MQSRSFLEVKCEQCSPADPTHNAVRGCGNSNKEQVFSGISIIRRNAVSKTALIVRKKTATKHNYFLGLALFMSLVFMGCGDSSNQEDIFKKPNTSEFYRLTSSEQKSLAPNELFKSIYTQDQKLFNRVVDSDQFDFSQKNEKEDTALAVAIKLKRAKMVDVLITKATKEDFKIRNKDGRGYFSLLVEYDMLESFNKAYDQYRIQAQFIGELWFSVVDFKDDLGRKASYYAQSYAMMDQLENVWFSSVTSVRHYFNNFYYDYDNEGNTFLHLAAKNQRVQVIKWYVERFCEYNSWENSNIPSFLSQRIGDALSNAEILPTRRRYINFQNDIGNTPLHVAAKHGRAKSITMLQTCYQVDPTVVNNDNRAPIAELLASIEPNTQEVSEEYKTSFFNLLYEVDPTWTRLDMELSVYDSKVGLAMNVGNNFKKLILKKDSKSWTALHYAALIRDPYFWNALKEFKYVQLQNDEGYTPEQLRSANEK